MRLSLGAPPGARGRAREVITDAGLLEQLMLAANREVVPARLSRTSGP